MTDRALDEADEQEAAQRYRMGWSTHRLARHFDTTDMSIRRTLDRMGVERRPPGSRRDDIDDDEIVRLRDEDGLSWPQIAVKTGLPRMTCVDHYARAKWPDRPDPMARPAKEDTERWLEATREGRIPIRPASTVRPDGPTPCGCSGHHLSGVRHPTPCCEVPHVDE
jgi:hypothetical protein